MSQQTSVDSFFGKRKRLAHDDIYRAKFLKTNEDSKEVLIKSKSVIDFPQTKLSNTGTIEDGSVNVKSATFKKPKPSASDHDQVNKEKPKVQLDIRESLKKCNEKQGFGENVNESPVKFQLLGSLSPAKKNNYRNKIRNEFYGSLQPISNVGKESLISEPGDSVEKKHVKNLDFDEKNKDCSTEDVIKSAQQLVSKIKETQKKLNGESNEKKEISLKGIKDKIKRSSKLNELKKSISKINAHAEQLIELENKKLLGAQPKLSKFKTIEIEVPVSPKKSALYSPVKVHKSPSKPAYQQFASLVDTSTLPLPFGFQRLFELFKAVDTVCSMMLNRGEVITFKKLKPAVEEMTRKNFTMRHLGQMTTVLPEGFSFYQQKLRNFGSTSKVDKYELVIVPTIPKTPENSKPHSEIQEGDVFKLADGNVMTPKILKERREAFYNFLLERTKDCHEEFLKSLDPPLTINRNDLKRWHPNFMVDLVPDVNPQELPQPPDTERPSSAKEVLERAKAFLSSNTRLQKALEVAAGSSEKADDIAAKISPEIKEKVDARLNDPLKGIPKSLLEKVRARQAAKALDAMRMTPAQEKETLMYTRLPDIARIVRTVFINEKKRVILLETLLEKVQFSYNRSLSLGEIETYVRLLVEKLPEWLTLVHLRNSDYLKITKNMDVSPVLEKLKKLVEDKKHEIKTI